MANNEANGRVVESGLLILSRQQLSRLSAAVLQLDLAIEPGRRGHHGSQVPVSGTDVDIDKLMVDSCS